MSEKKAQKPMERVIEYSVGGSSDFDNGRCCTNKVDRVIYSPGAEEFGFCAEDSVLTISWEDLRHILDEEGL